MNKFSEWIKTKNILVEMNITCDNCKKKFQVPDWLDTDIRCPQCKTTIGEDFDTTTIFTNKDGIRYHLRTHVNDVTGNTHFGRITRIQGKQTSDVIDFSELAPYKKEIENEILKETIRYFQMYGRSLPPNFKIKLTTFKNSKI